MLRALAADDGLIPYVWFNRALHSGIIVLQWGEAFADFPYAKASDTNANASPLLR
jgi:hypothetical protein